MNSSFFKGYFTCVAVYIVVMFAVLNSCARSNAAPGPVRALSISCTDTAGSYTPVVIASNNAGGVTNLLPAHFTRVCNEVYVSGRFASQGHIADTAQFSTVQISLPIPSNIAVQPLPCGQAVITQSLVRSVPGIVSLAAVNAAGVTIRWQPLKKLGYGVFYSFSYTVQ